MAGRAETLVSRTVVIVGLALRAATVVRTWMSAGHNLVAMEPAVWILSAVIIVTARSASRY